MADEDDDDLDLQPADAGAGFRAEMFATNFLLGYWPYLLGSLIVVLLGVFAYGQWITWVQKTQRGTTAEIAEATGQLPAPLPELPRLIAMADPAVTPDRLKVTADKLTAIGDAARPPAQVEAYLKAAELYRLAEAPESQRAVLTKAASNADGVLDFSAQAALANLDLTSDQGDAAEKRLRDLMSTYDGLLGQQAALDLGLALEHQDRGGDAATVYADFLERWPDSPLASEASERASRVGGAG